MSKRVHRNKGAKAKLRQKLKRLGAEAYGLENAKLIEQMDLIHKAANVIRLKGYKIVDQAENPEAKAILATELCRAMWLRAGEKTLAYHPYRGPVVDNWMIA